MIFTMQSIIWKYLQVFWSVIKRISVDMVDDFFRVKDSSDFLAGYDSMFKNTAMFFCHRIRVISYSFVSSLFAIFKKSFPMIILFSAYPKFKSRFKTPLRADIMFSNCGRFAINNITADYARNLSALKFSSSVMSVYKRMGSSIRIFGRQFFTTATRTFYFHSDIVAYGCKMSRSFL